MRVYPQTTQLDFLDKHLLKLSPNITPDLSIQDPVTMVSAPSDKCSSDR